MDSNKLISLFESLKEDIVKIVKVNNFKCELDEFRSNKWYELLEKNKVEISFDDLLRFIKNNGFKNEDVMRIEFIFKHCSIRFQSTGHFVYIGKQFSHHHVKEFEKYEPKFKQQGFKLVMADLCCGGQD